MSSTVDLAMKGMVSARSRLLARVSTVRAEVVHSKEEMGGGPMALALCRG